MSLGIPRAFRRDEPDTATRQDANRLAALARGCEAAGIHRNCLVVRLSALPADLRRPHHLRLAGDALDPLLSADRAQRFLLPNNDIVMVWRGTAEFLVQASRTAIARTFADVEGMPDPETLWRQLDLPTDNATLLAVVAESLGDDAPPHAEPPPGEPLDTRALAALEMALAQANVARFARRRAICGPGADGLFHLAWEVRALSAEAICAELAPGRAVAAEPWLYRRLGRTLDRRLLALLAATNELRSAGPFGLDLAVASILSADFLRFDAALPRSLRGRVTLGLEPPDIFADLAAFRFARDFARARDYRLMLRLPSGDLLPALPTHRLGLDLVEIGWSAAAIVLPIDLVDREAGRIVLAGADSPEALAWGRANGISLFEGRAVLAGQAAFDLATADA